jgi:hypothetical protein
MNNIMINNRVKDRIFINNKWKIMFNNRTLKIMLPKKIC